MAFKEAQVLLQKEPSIQACEEIFEIVLRLCLQKTKFLSFVLIHQAS